jgi:hypothetical protein
MPLNKNFDSNNYRSKNIIKLKSIVHSKTHRMVSSLQGDFPPRVTGLAATGDLLAQSLVACFLLCFFFIPSLDDCRAVAAEPGFYRRSRIKPVHRIENGQINDPVHHQEPVKNHGNERPEPLLLFFGLVPPHPMP